VTSFKNFFSPKKPIIIILNNLNSKSYNLIKSFFNRKSGIKIYDHGFNKDKILSLNPKIVLDIFDSNKTKGIYVNCSKSILDKIKNLIFNQTEIPFIGKVQQNKNKKTEIEIMKRGIPYCYIEFPINGYDEKTLIKSQLKIIKKISDNF
jgi:hypothetical protein